MSISFDRRALAVVAAVLLVGGSLLVVSQRSAEAQNQPANKVSAAGSTVEVAEPNQTVPILSETIKVSTPADLILQLTAECDILTELFTGGAGLAEDFAEAFGQVVMHIEIDGKRVPVSVDDAQDVGEVVFCNRAHEKSITDTEDDGIDEEREMTQTRQANGFNWLALNTGFDYDDFAVDNGKNILEIVVYATFTTEGTVLGEGDDETVKGRAEALVGNRTLIIEPTKVANSESVASGTEEPEVESTSKGKKP